MAADRHDLPDAQWHLLEPSYPTARHGAVAAGPTTAPSSTGSSGGSAPAHPGGTYRRPTARGSVVNSVYDRHRRWSADGTWDKVLEALRTECDLDLTAEEGEWAVSIDSSIMRAHHDAAGARGEPPRDVPPERLTAQVPPSPRERGRSGGQHRTRGPGSCPAAGQP